MISYQGEAKLDEGSMNAIDDTNSIPYLFIALRNGN